MFSDNLIALRKASKLTQSELAKRLGMGRSTVAMYEKGLREPSFETLEAIADFFNVPMSALLDSEEKVREAYAGYTKAITADRQAILDAVDGMSVEQLQKLLKIIEAIK